MVPELVRQQLGANALDIADKYSNATVYITTQWRLYDRVTGKPLFHKTWGLPGIGLLPAYVSLNGKLYRWLTTQDELHTNFRVGFSGRGSGFVIADQGQSQAQGLILTNKHVAAGWLVNYQQFFSYENKGRGFRFDAKETIPQFKRQDQYEKYMKGHLLNLD